MSLRIENAIMRKFMTEETDQHDCMIKDIVAEVNVSYAIAFHQCSFGFYSIIFLKFDYISDNTSVK
jgi:hypothetical protein